MNQRFAQIHELLYWVNPDLKADGHVTPRTLDGRLYRLCRKLVVVEEALDISNT
jgi:hypothetical protein